MCCLFLVATDGVHAWLKPGANGRTEVATIVARRGLCVVGFRARPMIQDSAVSAHTAYLAVARVVYCPTYLGARRLPFFGL